MKAWQILRGVIVLSFPYLLRALPPDKRLIQTLVVAGVAAYVLARTLVLFEPVTLSRHMVAGPLIWGEAIIVSLALTIALVAVGEGGVLPFGIGGGVAVVIGYLIYHILVLPIVGRLRLAKHAPAPRERKLLRHFIHLAAFFAEAGMVLMLMGMVLSEHDRMSSGPYSWWNVLALPWLQLILLVFCYAPVAALEAAADRSNETTDDTVRDVLEGLLVLAAGIYVAAITGSEPWL